MAPCVVHLLNLGDQTRLDLFFSNLWAGSLIRRHQLQRKWGHRRRSPFTHVAGKRKAMTPRRYRCGISSFMIRASWRAHMNNFKSPVRSYANLWTTKEELMLPTCMCVLSLPLAKSPHLSFCFILFCLSFCLCCWPLGLVALFYSWKTAKRNKEEDFEVLCRCLRAWGIKYTT